MHISASVDQPDLLENIVERLASRRYDIGWSKEKMPKTWEAIETSSNELYVSGTMELWFSESENFRIPFTTCFLFTCVHGKNDPYKLTWSSSLS